MGNRPKKPKRKPSGYNLFIKKCMGNISGELKGKPFGAAAPFMKKCTQEWKSFSESEKQDFKRMSDSCQLDEERNAWDCPT